MSKVTFECEPCAFKTQVYAGSWQKHLLKECHQRRARKRSDNLSEAERKRCVVVFGLRELPLAQVAKFFSSRWLLTDVIFWKDRPDFCIFEFLTQDFCRIAGRTKSISGKKVVIRFRNEISDIEWASIRPSSISVNSNADALASLSSSPKLTQRSLRSEVDQLSEEIDVITLDNSIENEATMEPMDEGYSLFSPPPPKRSGDDSDIKEMAKTRKKTRDLSAKKKVKISLVVRENKLGPLIAKRMENPSPKDMHCFWVELVREFNSLVWDNLFGIQLYEIPVGANTKRRRHSLIRGILSATGKPAITSSATYEAKKKELKQLLTSGLEPKPPLQKATPPDSTDASLTFDLRIRGTFPKCETTPKSVSKSGTSPKLASTRKCYLSLENIVHSQQVSAEQLKLITRMYRFLWNKFCQLKLK